MTISEQQTEQFAQEDAIVVRDALAPIGLRALARGMEKNSAAPSRYATRDTSLDAPGGFDDGYRNWQRIDEYRAFIEKSPAAETAGRSMERRGG